VSAVWAGQSAGHDSPLSPDAEVGQSADGRETMALSIGVANQLAVNGPGFHAHLGHPVNNGVGDLDEAPGDRDRIFRAEPRRGEELGVAFYRDCHLLI